MIHLRYASLGDLFQGREEVLATLHQKLTEGKSGKATAIAAKANAVHGLGGVGKSRLAIEYGWRYADEYSAVLFVGAASPGELRRNLAALCETSVLDLPEKIPCPRDVQTRWKAVRRWFLGRPPTVNEPLSGSRAVRTQRCAVRHRPRGEVQPLRDVRRGKTSVRTRAPKPIF